MPHDQPQPGSFLHKREEPRNEVDSELAKTLGHVDLNSEERKAATQLLIEEADAFAIYDRASAHHRASNGYQTQR